MLREFLILAFLSSPALAKEPAVKPMTVEIISVDSNHWHWRNLLEIMRKAATDLGIDLKITDSARDHLLYRKMAVAVFSQPAPPDYLIIGNEKESAAKIIDASDKTKTKVFLFNNGFVSPENKTAYAQPRKNHPQWIGQLIPNNFQAGYDAAIKLIEVMQRTYPDQDLPLLGLSGSFRTHASVERERGFLAAAAKFPRANVKQIVSADWSGALAESKTTFLLNRYPKILGIWAANDEMAEGAMRGAQKHRRVPGKDIFFSGCGWSKTGVAAVREKRMVVSTGGHFMDGAWVLARLFDYHQSNEGLENMPPGNFIVMDENNALELSNILDKQKWKTFDFKKWTKFYNPHLKSYADSSREYFSVQASR